MIKEKPRGKAPFQELAEVQSNPMTLLTCKSAMIRETLFCIAVVMLLSGCATLEAVFDDLGGGTPQEPRAIVLSQAKTAGVGAISIPDPAQPDAPSRTRVIQDSCGIDLACLEGWDLRILEVDQSFSHVPARSELPVRVRIQNRGTEASPVTEAHLCFVEIQHTFGSCPAGERTLLTIPSIEAAETVDLTLSLRVPARESGQSWIWVVPDPDHLLGRDRIEAAWSEPLELELPKLQFLELEAPPVQHRSGRLIAQGTIRNSSFATISPAIEMEVYPMCLSSRTPRPRISLPALDPRESYTFEVELNVGTGGHPNEDCRFYSNAETLRFRLDPDGIVNWSRSHESGADTRYGVIGR